MAKRDENDRRAKRHGQRLVWFFQALFVVVMLFQLDEPFLGAHNERQNETFDMARHVYRDGWRSVLTPKVSYSWPNALKQPYTAMLMEVPFHGIIAWPFTYITSHERALMRLVSTAFALMSIQLLYWILYLWVSPAAAAAAAGCWAMAPLVLQFGQVPMPDIISTAGLLLAFWFALRGKLPAASLGFLFSMLAKPNSIVFGLPVLVALLLARNCRSVRDILRVSILWGWLPLVGIVAWEFLINYFTPPTDMTILDVMGRSGENRLLRLSFYKFLFGCLFPMGTGVLGFLGIIFAWKGGIKRLAPWLKVAIILSNFAFIVLVVRKVAEVQYTLIILIWLIMAASFGFEFLLAKWCESRLWRTGLAAAMIVHVLMAIFFTVDLKGSRAPNYPDIVRAGSILPPDARVIVLYRYYGASPAIWLNRNVVAVGGYSPSFFPSFCEKAFAAGFTHVMILDMESWHDPHSHDSPLAMIKRVLNVGHPNQDASVTGLTSPSSLFRQYCDLVFEPIFSGSRVVLYSMASFPKNKQLGEKIIPTQPAK